MFTQVCDRLDCRAAPVVRVRVRRVVGPKHKVVEGEQELCPLHRDELRQGDDERLLSVITEPIVHRVACAWCQVTMTEGVEPTSHSICPSCLAAQMSELERVRE